jgi:hypothetical protein
MRAIDFIVQDAGRAAPSPVRNVLLGLGLALVAAGLGLGMRRDFVEAFTPGNLWPPLLVAAALAAFPALYAKRFADLRRPGRRLSAALFAVVVVLLAASLLQPQTRESLRKFVRPERFWFENLHCLKLGVLTGAVVAALLAVATQRWLPMPNRRWRLVLATVAGLAGLGALGFHCMGALRSHVVIAHWGQGLIAMPIAYATQSWLFRRRMRTIVGKDGGLRWLGRLG